MSSSLAINTAILDLIGGLDHHSQAWFHSAIQLPFKWPTPEASVHPSLVHATAFMGFSTAARKFGEAVHPNRFALSFRPSHTAPSQQPRPNALCKKLEPILASVLTNELLSPTLDLLTIAYSGMELASDLRSRWNSAELGRNWHGAWGDDIRQVQLWHGKTAPLIENTLQAIAPAEPNDRYDRPIEQAFLAAQRFLASSQSPSAGFPRDCPE